MGNLYSKNITPNCVYCVNGELAKDGETVLCVKKGIMKKDDFCKKFTYDPLKRTPRRAQAITGFSAEDFQL